MSIKEILENFLEHVNKLDAADDNEEDGYTKEYMALRKLTFQYRTKDIIPCNEGKKECNIKKNRYKDIIPYDETRVKLPTVQDVDGSDYINANFVKGATGHQTYIAAQGPLPQTVDDFVRMLWQYEVRIVIMAANEFENNKHKCQKYWPEEGETLTFGDVSISSKSEVSHDHGEFVERVLVLSAGGSERYVYHYHYVAWPDHGTPTSVLTILDVIASARVRQRQMEWPPIVVHCSAGCGRTGTIIAIDYVWNLLKIAKLTKSFSLYELIKSLRQQRPSIVQSVDQYIFVHLAIKVLFEGHLRLMQHHLYENVTIATPSTPGNGNQGNGDEDDYQDISGGGVNGPGPRSPRLELYQNVHNSVNGADGLSPSDTTSNDLDICIKPTSPAFLSINETIEKLIENDLYSPRDQDSSLSDVSSVSPSFSNLYADVDATGKAPSIKRPPPPRPDKPPPLNAEEAPAPAVPAKTPESYQLIGATPAPPQKPTPRPRISVSSGGEDANGASKPLVSPKPGLVSPKPSLPNSKPDWSNQKQQSVAPPSVLGTKLPPPPVPTPPATHTPGPAKPAPTGRRPSLPQHLNSGQRSSGGERSASEDSGVSLTSPLPSVTSQKPVVVARSNNNNVSMVTVAAEGHDNKVTATNRDSELYRFASEMAGEDYDVLSNWCSATDSVGSRRGVQPKKDNVDATTPEPPAEYSLETAVPKDGGRRGGGDVLEYSLEAAVPTNKRGREVLVSREREYMEIDLAGEGPKSPGSAAGGASQHEYAYPTAPPVKQTQKPQQQQQPAGPLEYQLAGPVVEHPPPQAYAYAATPPSPGAIPGQGRTPPGRGKAPATAAEEYAYAHANDNNKWSLQHYALKGEPTAPPRRNRPSADPVTPGSAEYSYSGLGGEYEDVGAGEPEYMPVEFEGADKVFNDSDEGDGSARFRRAEGSASDDSVSLDSISGAAHSSKKAFGARFKAKLATLGNIKKPSSLGSVTLPYTVDGPVQVMFKGRDISFPHRVGTPRGKRSCPQFT